MPTDLERMARELARLTRYNEEYEVRAGDILDTLRKAFEAGAEAMRERCVGTADWYADQKRLLAKGATWPNSSRMHCAADAAIQVREHIRSLKPEELRKT